MLQYTNPCNEAVFFFKFNPLKLPSPLKAKLEKSSDTLRKSGAPFFEFMDRMDRWLLKNANKAIELYRRFDQTGEGMVTYDEFKAGNNFCSIRLYNI